MASQTSLPGTSVDQPNHHMSWFRSLFLVVSTAVPIINKLFTVGSALNLTDFPLFIAAFPPSRRVHHSAHFYTCCTRSDLPSLYLPSSSFPAIVRYRLLRRQRQCVLTWGINIVTRTSSFNIASTALPSHPCHPMFSHHHPKRPRRYLMESCRHPTVLG